MSVDRPTLSWLRKAWFYSILDAHEECLNCGYPADGVIQVSRADDEDVRKIKSGSKLTIEVSLTASGWSRLSDGRYASVLFQCPADGDPSLDRQSSAVLEVSSTVQGASKDELVITEPRVVKTRPERDRPSTPSEQQELLNSIRCNLPITRHSCSPSAMLFYASDPMQMVVAYADWCTERHRDTFVVAVTDDPRFVRCLFERGVTTVTMLCSNTKVAFDVESWFTANCSSSVLVGDTSMPLVCGIVHRVQVVTP